MPALTLVATEYEMLGQMARIMSALRVLRPAYAGMEKSDRQVFLKSLWGEVVSANLMIARSSDRSGLGTLIQTQAGVYRSYSRDSKESVCRV